MPVIKFELTDESISAAIEQIEQYHKKVGSAGYEITKRLTEQGVQLAKDNAKFMNAYDSGELVNGIQSQYRNGKGYIAATAPHSAFVEFGTGIRGKESQHPNPGLANWKYDVNEHGEAGWSYLGDDGEWHWTAGMPSRPFMYNTAKALNSYIEGVAREVLEK